MIPLCSTEQLLNFIACGGVLVISPLSQHLRLSQLVSNRALDCSINHRNWQLPERVWVDVRDSCVRCEPSLQGLSQVRQQERLQEVRISSRFINFDPVCASGHQAIFWYLLRQHCNSPRIPFNFNYQISRTTATLSPIFGKPRTKAVRKVVIIDFATLPYICRSEIWSIGIRLYNSFEAGNSDVNSIVVFPDAVKGSSGEMLP